MRLLCSIAVAVVWMMLIYSVVLLHAMIFIDNTSLMHGIAVVCGMDNPILPCNTAAVILTDSTNLMYSVGVGSGVDSVVLYSIAAGHDTDSTVSLAVRSIAAGSDTH